MGARNAEGDRASLEVGDWPNNPGARGSRRRSTHVRRARRASTLTVNTAASTSTMLAPAATFHQ